MALLHGFGGNHIEPHALFTSTARALAAGGIGALRFDFGGSGDSEGLFQDATLSGEVSDAHAALRFLAAQPKVDAERLGLLGLSLGGLIAACTAAASPRVRALVLWAAVANLGELFAAAAVPGQLDQLDRAGYVDLDGLAVGEALVDEAVTTDPLGALSGYGGPALLVHGTADAVVPFSHSLRYKTALGDRARLLEVEGADHVFSSLPWAETVRSSTLSWLRGRLLRGTTPA